MPHFVLAYNRPLGRLVAPIEEFEDSDAGMQRLFELERQHRLDPDMELVMLSAASEDQIRRTHSRYFKTTAELLADLRALVAER